MIALHSFEKRFYAILFYVSMLYFAVWMLWPELQIYLQRVYSVVYFKPIAELQNLLPLSLALDYFSFIKLNSLQGIRFPP